MVSQFNTKNQYLDNQNVTKNHYASKSLFTVNQSINNQHTR